MSKPVRVFDKENDKFEYARQPSLCLERDSGEAQWLSSDRIREIIPDLKRQRGYRPLELVFLSACHSDDIVEVF